MPSISKPRKERQRHRYYWVVSLGKRLTHERRRKHYFRSRKDAAEFVRQTESSRQELGRESVIIPLELRAEALACDRRLRPHAATITQAVNFFLRHIELKAKSKTFEEIREEFIRSRRAMNCRIRTLVQYESYLRVIAEEFGKAFVTEITTPDIEDWLEESDWAVRTKRNYLVTIGTVLDFALKRGYIAQNPTIGIARPILDDKPPGILSPSQARHLLEKAQAITPKIVQALAISLFAGLRRSEVCTLHWCEIDLATKTIEVKGSKAKTRQRRIVTISDNLFLWLSLAREKSGPIFPSNSPDAFGELLRECAVAAEVKPWPHNAARHSFASYYYAKTQDELKTAAQMGNSPSVLFRHYRALVKGEAVEDYWAIAP